MLPLVPALPLLFAALTASASSEPYQSSGHAAGFATITKSDARAWVDHIASPWYEGRDTPSATQDLAAEWLAKQLADFGLEHAPGHESYIVPWSRNAPAPDEKRSTLVLANVEPTELFALGTDFVPLLGAEGSASGPLVFAGFGISVPEYDDLKGVRVDGAIALIFEGEPRHKKVLEGPAVSPAANVFRKLEALKAKGARGALIIRRGPPGDPPRPAGFPDVAPLGFRSSWGTWVGERPEPLGPVDFPALELSLAAAERLAGVELGPWAEEIDQRGKPRPLALPAGTDGTPRTVSVESRIVSRAYSIPNVVGVVPAREGGDPKDYLVLGAHFDHVGVDPRGRIGTGADDNGSGTVAALLVARALVTADPRRPVLVCFFSGEEKGLLGAAAFLANPPIPVERMGFMLNLDMVGRGAADGLAAIGATRIDGLERVLTRASKLGRVGFRNLDTRGGQELWERSDHYEFHKRGVPVMFFFEELPIERNRDYHTWRDTADLVDAEKVARAARLAFNLLWLMGEDSDLPKRTR